MPVHTTASGPKLPAGADKWQMGRPDKKMRRQSERRNGDYRSKRFVGIVR